MRKLILGAAFAIVASPIAATAQNAEAIIDRAVAAYGRLTSMRSEFRQTLTNPLTGSTQTTSGVILRKKPNLLSITSRAEIASPPTAPTSGSTFPAVRPDR
jgi:outer membrane lipoprotein-sorting protein